MFNQLKSLTVFLAVVLSVFSSSFSLQAQWIKKTTGLPYNLGGNSSSIDACDQDVAVVSTGRNVYRTINGGESWHKLQLPDDIGFIWDISMVDSSHIWICDGKGQIFATSDAGRNWALQFSDDTKTKFMNYIEMFNFNEGVAMGDYCDYRNHPEGPAVFLNTSDGGNNWISVNDSAFGGASGDTWRRLDFVSPHIGYFQAFGLSPKKIYKTTDRGKTWHSTNYPEGEGVMVIKFYDENIGLVISRENVLYRTLDGGETWEFITAPNKGLSQEDIEFSPDDPAKVWMADDFSLFFSSDTGKTWNKQLSDCGPSDIVFVDNLNGWFTGSKGLYHTTSGGSTGVEKKDTNKLDDFILHQNYPNPFNPTTTIKFSIKEQSHVSLKIYNIMGQEIIELVQENFVPGEYNIIWDGRNRVGQLVGSELYFAKLENGKNCRLIKMLLVR